MTKTLPRVLIAGTSSGSGKTTAVCAILTLLKRRGIGVTSAGICRMQLYVWSIPL